MAEYPARADKNQADIVHMFKMQHCSVQHLHAVGAGCPDLLVGVPTNSGGVNILVEVKYGKGKLTKPQARWHADWKGQVEVVHNVAEALGLIKAVRQSANAQNIIGDSLH